MFKSIDYKLYFYLILLIFSVSGTVYFALTSLYVYMATSIFIAIYSISSLFHNYNKYNKNILFLLNALDNGDYSFNFAETNISRRERELNQMMNRIKEILSNARQDVIEREKFLSIIIQNVPTGILILDEKDNIRNTNRAASRFLGLPILTHLNQLKILDPTFPQFFKDLKVSDDHKQITVVGEKEVSQVSLRVSEIKIQGENLRIITLYSIQDELDRREMESWTKLVRVMTHEIMNSIAPITSLSEMLIYMYETDSQNENIKNITVDSLSTINTTAKELAGFVDSYRQFSGVATPHLKEIDLLPFIDAILNLERAELEDRKIEVIIQSNVEAISVLGDSTQLSRVLVNIIKNAIEAFGTVKCKTIKIDILVLGDKVQIDISNNGIPIPNNVLENIFIPFFTTKDSGSGIGLSVSRYIMRLHDGNLKHSYENGWTIFSLSIRSFIE